MCHLLSYLNFCGIFFEESVVVSLVFLETTGFDCGGADVLGVIKFVWSLLDIVFIVVPIGLIVMASLDFAKNVMSGKDDEMKKNAMMVLKRLIFCVALFLVMPIVEFAISLLGKQDVSYAKCIEIATTEDLSQYKIEYDDNYDVPEPDFSKDPGMSASSSGISMTDVDYTHLNIYNQTGTYARNMVCVGGKSTVSAGACGLSAYMAIRYVLTKKDTKFMDFCHEACSTGFFNGKGTSWEIVQTNSIYQNNYGIISSRMTVGYDEIVKELKQGHAVSVLIQAGRQTTGEGGFNFTVNQHFIALVGYDSSNDKIYVYNPTGANTGWTSKDIVQKYIINCTKGIWSVKAA